MYAVDKIIDNIVVIENLETGFIIEINKYLINGCVKEGDVLSYDGEKYIVDEESTKSRRSKIQSLFDSLREKD